MELRVALQWVGTVVLSSLQRQCMSSLELHYEWNYSCVECKVLVLQWTLLTVLYISVKFTMGSSPVTDPVKKVNGFIASSPATVNSSFSLLFSLCLNLIKLFYVKPQPTWFLSASVCCVELHPIKLLSGKRFAVHSAQRRNNFSTSDFYSPVKGCTLVVIVAARTLLFAFAKD